MGLQPAGRNLPTLGVSSLPNHYQCPQVAIGHFKMPNKYAAEYSTHLLWSLKLCFSIQDTICARIAQIKAMG